MDFEDALRSAVSIGGDFDAVAAITSSSARVFYHDVCQNPCDDLIAEANQYLPQELMDTIVSFDRKASGRTASNKNPAAGKISPPVSHPE